MHKLRLTPAYVHNIRPLRTEKAGLKSVALSSAITKFAMILLTTLGPPRTLKK